VWWLVQEDLISWPVLPWSEVTAPAFRVDRPLFRTVDNHEEIAGLDRVGYHQRFEINGERILPNVLKEVYSVIEPTVIHIRTGGNASNDLRK
jgi:hypothetical protein